MQRLFLVRHGETEGRSSVRLHGRGDTPLSGLGRLQARALGIALARERIAAVFHSPLSRAVQTAEIIADVAAQRPRVLLEPGLREIDFGELEGLTLEEARARHAAFAALWERGEAERFPGGDSIQEFRRGAADAVERCLLLEPDGDVLVVAHKGVVRAALERFTARLALGPQRFEIDLGSVSCLTRRDTGWIVTSWNEVPGLPPD